MTLYWYLIKRRIGSSYGRGSLSDYIAQDGLSKMHVFIQHSLISGTTIETPKYLQGRDRSSIGVGQSRHGDVNRLQTCVGHTTSFDEADHLVLGTIRRAVTIDEHAIGVRFGHAYHANGKLARGAI